VALLQVASVGGGVVTLSVDINTSGVCVGAQLVNNSGRDVLVTIFKGADDIASGVFGPGTHTKNLNGPRRFTWAAADDVRAELTVRWP
jgi:hypothetical protein